jgi:hypothetical protein
MLFAASGWRCRHRGTGVATVEDSSVRTTDAASVATAASPSSGQPFGELPPFPGLLRHPLRSVGWIVTVGIGLVSLVVLLAIVAAIPVANFAALGYMLEAQGRVVRSGRLRDGVPFAGALPRLGAIVLGSWAWLLAVRLVTQAAADAALVDPGGPSALGWRRAQAFVVAAVGLHLVAALFAGGSLVAFFRPLRNVRRLAAAVRAGTAWGTAADALGRVVDRIAPGRLFWLGLRGFAGGLLWLFLPTALFAALRDTTQPVGVLAMLVGGVLLAFVLCWVPFLQARFAAEGRMRAFREVAAVRELWRRGPIAMLLAVAVLYALSLPLYLFKVLATPRDAVLFLTPIFILTIYPARLAVAWAVHWAASRPRRRWVAIRLVAAAVLLPLLAIYLFLLFFTPAIDALGRRVLFDHHAILLPTPF